MYYMGVTTGVSFRAVANVRAPWTGGLTRYVYDSDTDPDAIVSLMETAGKLRKEWATESVGMEAEE